MEQRRGNEIDSELSSNFNKYSSLPFILGSFPLKLSDADLAPTILGSFWSLVLISLVLACNLVLFLAPSTDFSNVSSTKEVTFYLDHVALNIAILLQLWSIVRRRKRLLYVIRVLSKVKRNLFATRIQWKPKHRLWGSLAQSVSFACVSIMDPESFDVTVFGLANSTSYYYQVEVIIWTCTQFMWFADGLAEAFRGLTECLAQATSSGDVEFLIKSHYLLTKATNQLNDTYSLGLTLAFVSSFILALSSSYEMILEIIEGAPFVWALVLFIWAIVLIILFFRIVDSCSFVRYQAKRFDSTLYRLLVYKSPSNVSQNVTAMKLFFHFSSKPNLNFTLSGCFNLDWNLLYSMMAAGCTYLIVMVQINHLS